MEWIRQVLSNTGLLPYQRRRKRIMRGFRTDGIGLEIGPSHKPIAPRREGFRVKAVDCMDRTALIERYRGLGIDTSRIEEVDYVWSGERYADLMGGTQIFDWIISSHSIEHVPDLVGFLNDCKEILKVGVIGHTKVIHLWTLESDSPGDRGES